MYTHVIDNLARVEDTLHYGGHSYALGCAGMLDGFISPGRREASLFQPAPVQSPELPGETWTLAYRSAARLPGLYARWWLDDEGLYLVDVVSRYNKTVVMKDAAGRDFRIHGVVSYWNQLFPGRAEPVPATWYSGALALALPDMRPPSTLLAQRENLPPDDTVRQWQIDAIWYYLNISVYKGRVLERSLGNFISPQLELPFFPPAQVLPPELFPDEVFEGETALFPATSEALVG